MTLSYAIVRDDPPEVYLAEDIDTLHWVLALQVVARSRPDELPGPAVSVIRGALLDERWADATSAATSTPTTWPWRATGSAT